MVRRLLCALVILGPVGAGCGRSVSRPRVRGKVTFAGAPVGHQTLTLYSPGAPGEFFTQKLPLLADGTFAGEVAAPGTYKVSIEESLAVQEGQKPAAADRKRIPPKYRNPATADLVWDIHEGDNYREFDLQE